MDYVALNRLSTADVWEKGGSSRRRARKATKLPGAFYVRSLVGTRGHGQVNVNNKIIV